MSELYKRQETLNLDIPEQITVIGVGGIGCWVSIGLAMAGVKKLILIDTDSIEEHNLNRLPFGRWSVGVKKVDSLMQFLNEVRPECEIIAYPNHTDNLSRVSLEKINRGVIVDCRDNIRPLKGMNKPLLKVGYNGTSITVHTNPDYDSIFGDDLGGYTIIPSWVGTPMLIGGLCAHIICDPKKSIDEKLVTFDAFDIIDGMIAYGVKKHVETRNE